MCIVCIYTYLYKDDYLIINRMTDKQNIKNLLEENKFLKSQVDCYKMHFYKLTYDSIHKELQELNDIKKPPHDMASIAMEFNDINDSSIQSMELIDLFKLIYQNVRESIKKLKLYENLKFSTNFHNDFDYEFSKQDGVSNLMCVISVYYKNYVEQ